MGEVLVRKAKGSSGVPSMKPGEARLPVFTVTWETSARLDKTTKSGCHEQDIELSPFTYNESSSVPSLKLQISIWEPRPASLRWHHEGSHGYGGSNADDQLSQLQ
jgi:hypothetical protein